MIELSVNVYEPLTVGDTFLKTIERPEGYTHTIQALGGYWSASFSISGNRLTIDDWLQDGIGRRVVCYNRIKEVWEGFVNEVEVRHGGLTVRQGPLLDIGNRIKVSYSGVDLSTEPPTVGVQVETSEADNEESQALYGIIPKVIAANEVTESDAELIRNTALVEMAYPKTSRTWSSGSAGDYASVTLRCLGYVHYLLYPYSQTTNVGEQDASDKIIDILDADPNSLFSTDYVEENTVQVPQYEYENTPAWPLIQEIVNRGGTGSERWLFGIYENRTAYCAEAPGAVEYWGNLSDPAQRVRSATEDGMPYPEVRPGKWLLFADFLVGFGRVANLRKDPRAVFIEQVTFTAPNTIAVNGGTTDRIPQLLARGIW